MKVLLTGGTGFIGSHLAEALIKKGYTLRCLVRNTSNLASLEGLPVEFIHGDLADMDSLDKAVQGVDYVYHVAGITKAISEKKYYTANYTGTKNLVNACIKKNPQLIKFIYLSSLSAAGPSFNGEFISESMPCNPVSAYGKSKLIAEMFLQKSMDQLPFVIIRPPAVYGPRETDLFTYFKFINNGYKPIIGAKEKFLSFVYVDDLVRGCILAGEKKTSTSKTYFIANEKIYSWSEFTHEIEENLQPGVKQFRIPSFVMYPVALFSELKSLFTGKPPLLNREKIKEFMQDYWICSVSKARIELGYKSSVSLSEGIRITTEWYKQRGWL